MSLLKTCILALSAITANAWDAAEKEAALKVVDECARSVADMFRSPPNLR